MIKSLLPLLLLGSLSCAAADAPKPAAAAAPTPIAQLLPQITFFNATPSTTAEYYIVLRSAIWCPPCRANMPSYAKSYLEMKQSGKIEIIFWSADKNEADAKKFVKEYNATFPTTMDASLLRGAAKGGFIPRAYVFDKQGKLVYDGSSNIIKEWKTSFLNK